FAFNCRRRYFLSVVFAKYVRKIKSPSLFALSTIRAACTALFFGCITPILYCRLYAAAKSIEVTGHEMNGIFFKRSIALFDGVIKCCLAASNPVSSSSTFDSLCSYWIDYPYS
ncbi:hypothetical protein ACTFIY_002766, partial [Dictyostelium cf. discoideum]